MTVTETKRATAGEVSEGAQAERERQGERTTPEGDLLALDTPVVSVHIHRPHLHLPRMTTAPAERAVRAARSALPAPSRLVYYGGLGAMAALGAIEWPVAIAIGVGTAIGQRVRRDGKRARRTGEPTAESVPEPATEPATGPTAETATEPPSGPAVGVKAQPASEGKGQTRGQAGTGTKTEAKGEGKSRS